MARLMPASSTDYRPKMVSQYFRKPDKAPSTSKKFSCSRSMVQETCREESPVRFRPNTLQFRSDRKSITPPFDTAESIDLTGSTDHLTSVSLIAESGGQALFQAEETVSCRDACEGRGTKRKCEEYASGSMETRELRNVSLPLTMGETSAELLVKPTRVSRTSPSQNFKLSKYNSPNQLQNCDEKDEDDWFDVENVENMVPSVSSDFGPQPSPVYDEKDSKEDTCKDALPQPARNEEKTELKEAQPIPKIPSPQEHDKNFMDFVALSPEYFAQLKSSLKETIQINAELAYDRSIRDLSAVDLIAANKGLVSQIHAIEMLQKMRKAYGDLAAHRAVIKQGLMRKISQGLDPTDMPEELERCRAVEDKLHETDITIRVLLPRAKIFDMA